MAARPSFASSYPQVGYIVPLYVDPNKSTGQIIFNNLIAVHQANPSVPVIAIINPGSGPCYNGSCAANGNYLTYIQSLQFAGIQVMGYVDTAYGNAAGGVPLSTAKSYMYDYKNWYGTNGIFLDEMDNVPGESESYYTSLTSYGHSLGFSLIIGNPGTTTVSSYIGTVDMMIGYENGGLPSASNVYGDTIGIGGQRAQWGIIAFTVSSVPSISYLQGVSNDISWIYVTDAIGPPPITNNPYDVAPTYQNTEVSNLAISGSGSTTTQSSTTSAGGGGGTTTTTTSTMATNTNSSNPQLLSFSSIPLPNFTGKEWYFLGLTVFALFSIPALIQKKKRRRG